MSALDSLRRAIASTELEHEFDRGVMAGHVAISREWTRHEHELLGLAAQWEATALTQPAGPTRATLITCASNLRALVLESQ